MKRLALLTVTAFMAVILTACGENAQKKAETSATTSTQSHDATGAAGTSTPSTTQSGQ